MQLYHKDSISSSWRGGSFKNVLQSLCWRASLENIGSLLLLLNNYIREGLSNTSMREGRYFFPFPPSPLALLLAQLAFWKGGLRLASAASGSRPQGNSCCSKVCSVVYLPAWLCTLRLLRAQGERRMQGGRLAL